jgi:hypothetical protein
VAKSHQIFSGFDSAKTLAAENQYCGSGSKKKLWECGTLRMLEASPGQSYFILQFHASMLV